MNKEIMLFSLTAFFAIFNTAQAMEIKHGTLVSHKEWNSGSFTSKFPEGPTDAKHALILKQLNQIMHANTYTENLNATDDLNSTSLTGTTTTPTVIAGTTNVNISNMSANSQTYSVTTKICVEGASFPVQCANSYDVFQLDTQGIATITRLPSMSITIPTAGNYTIFIGTDISEGANTALYSFFTNGKLVIS